MPPRIAFSTLAFPDATLAAAVSLGRRWGYAGITGDGPGPELRRFLQLASDWNAPLVRVFGDHLGPPPDPARPGQGRPPYRRREMAALPLGAGEVPVREMPSLLQAAGYPHWITACPAAMLMAAFTSGPSNLC